MNPRSCRLRRKLRAGEPATMLKVNLSDPRVVEIAGLCGVDAVWLCQEHVPGDWLSLENQIRAARAQGIDSLVRVSRGSYSDYVRPLEAGATGIIVPHLASVGEARAVVDWTRFHPLGRRALDGGNADGSFCLAPLEQYLRESNEQQLIVFQIESPEALEEVEAIAAVPGFDALMFGPGDFSQRIGKPGQLDAPEVVAARKRIGAAARLHGKHAISPGMLAPLECLMKEGYLVFSAGADVVGLGSYVRDRLATLDNQARAAGVAVAQSPYS